MTVCKHVYYWGKVQGVGFRYTTADLARRYPVNGYVKNLHDGQVELFAEGATADVDRFLQAVARQMADFIQGHKVEDETPQGFTEFAIRS